MSKRDKIAFGIYLICVLASLSFGIVYFSCSTIMPYHKEAINMRWDELNIGLQVLLQGFIKVAAAGFFVTGLSVLIILLIPFKQGAQWAHWAVPLLGAVWNVPGLYVTTTIALKTNASTPWPASVLAMILIFVAFILSPGFSSRK